MRWLQSLLLAFGCLCLVATQAAPPHSSGRVVKVLPHYLDLQGRQSLSPSLYERDAYQAELRKHPAQCSALRFDINWKTLGVDKSRLKLRVEIRAGRGAETKTYVLEQAPPKQKFFGKWTALTFGGEDFKQAGEIIAWRVSMWLDDTLLSEQKSFLW